MNPENGAADEWGERDREHQARRAEAGTSKGKAYAARLTSLPPAEAAAEVRSMFAESETRNLARDIANDLQLDPEKAELVAREIAASRRRIARATRPFRRRGEPADPGVD